LDGVDDSGFSIEDFWAHSLAVAIISRYISERTKIQDPDDCFVGGLLHDIGLVIIARFFPQALASMLHIASEKKESIYEAENATMPVKHNKIGEIVAKKWQLPPAVCDILKYHHTPNKWAANPELLAVVHLGDVIARRFFLTSINPVSEKITPILTGANPSSEKKLEQVFKTSVEWFPEIREKIREACCFFIGDKEDEVNG
jgi:putative nucleotidyltransferase with HDIG domain